MITVTVAAPDRNLLTAAETRAAIGDSGAVSAATIDALRERVAAAIVHACRVERAGVVPPTLRLETLTEDIRLPAPQEVLVLARFPIVAVTSVVENGITLAAAEYEIDAGRGLMTRLSADDPTTWPSGRITLVYSAGWETVPVDLKLAAEKVAADFYFQTARDPNLKRVHVDGVGEREYWVPPADDPLISEEVRMLLADYTNHQRVG